MTDLTPVANAVIALLAAHITAFVIPWLRRKTTEQDREELLKWVEIAVAAAQQLFHQLDGVARKQYVLDFPGPLWQLRYLWKRLLRRLKLHSEQLFPNWKMFGPEPILTTAAG